jgi:hypothetical protein
MAGTPLNWTTLNIPRGKRVELWAKVAVPAAGARISLFTDGTPDGTANPNALPLGRTTDGAQIQYATTLQSRISDEFDAPFDSSIEMVEGIIACNLMNTLDTDIMNLIMVGTTKATGTGYEELAFGGLQTVTKVSVVAIFEMPEDSSKRGVFQLYSALNNQKLAWQIRHSGNTIGSTPVAFQGYSVSSRAAGDQIGKYWKQVA